MHINTKQETKVRIKLLEGGYCTHKEKMVIKGGRNETVKFPSMFALIIHPKEGVILFDTGYTKRFYKETSSFPFSIYAKMTPVYVNDEDTAVSKLKALGINPEDVKYIIISHFHADHIAALRDFPNCKYIYLKNGYDNVKNSKGFKALKQGYLKGLLPDDFEKRSIEIDTDKSDYLVSPIKPFDKTFDFFGDGSILLIPLEGHYRGHLGALVNSHDNQKYFLIADSCWLSKSFRENITPSSIASIIMDNPKMYKETLHKIHKFHKNNSDINILPSHCSEVYDKYIKDN